jgi:hypothetical protein
MKVTPKLLLIGIFALILGLGLASWWHYKSFKRTLSEAAPFSLNLPEYEFELESKPQEPETLQDFVVPAGDLKITYPSSWQKIDDSEFNFTTLDTETSKTLFYAIRVDPKGTKMAWLIIQGLNFGKERTLENIIEKIKTTGEERGIKTGIQNLETEENMAQFKITQEQGGYSTIGEEKIILTEDNIYSILVFSLTSDWASFRDETRQILNSAQALPAE